MTVLSPHPGPLTDGAALQVCERTGTVLRDRVCVVRLPRVNHHLAGATGATGEDGVGFVLVFDDSVVVIVVVLLLLLLLLVEVVIFLVFLVFVVWYL